MFFSAEEYRTKQERPKVKWWKRLFAPHHEMDGRIYRCQCGKLYTERAYKDKVFMQDHVGHRVSIAMAGTLWEFICIKMGWIK